MKQWRRMEKEKVLVELAKNETLDVMMNGLKESKQFGDLFLSADETNRA